MSGLVIFGTRPEAIKLAPVVAEIKAASEGESLRVVSTGQHAEIMQQTLGALTLGVDTSLNVMSPNQTPMQVIERVIVGLTERYADEQPDWVLVQGDTATAFAGALFGYLCQCPVIHLEAGLRTHDIREPWPEEGFRQGIARLASLHLAPYPRARENLVAEGIDADAIRVVGNPGLDSQNATIARIEDECPVLPDRDFFLVTLHRRENLGPRLETTCRHLERLLADYAEHSIVWPVHPNPAVRRTAFRFFGRRDERIRLCEPLDYPQFLQAQAAARLVISDSGGVQEEAASLATPVAIVREKSERPEAIELGLTKLVGADARNLVSAAASLLSAPPDPAAVAQWRRLQGDGHAAKAAAQALLDHVTGDQAGRRRA